jgi:hypothetical protein
VSPLASRAACAAATLAIVLGGCGGNATSGEGEASCALVVRYQGQTYGGVGVEVAPREGKRLGTGVLPGCEEGEPDEEIEVAEIEGVPPEIALVWHKDFGTVFISERVDRLAPELKRFMNAPKCDPHDEPIDLAGPWLGILGADGENEVGMVPPYDLEFFVQETTTSRYERAFLTVRVPEHLGRPLTRGDLRASLWEGGTIELTVGCRDGRYVAEGVSAHPPS